MDHRKNENCLVLEQVLFDRSWKLKLLSAHSEFLIWLSIWLKSTKSGPVGFEKMDFSHFSPCSMQWMFQTPGVSIVHVQKTVSYNNL